jgi:glycosyltransferase involved in cell wall biosynthesis
MRVLLVHPGPDFSVADLFNGYHRALKSLGIDVAVYNTNERLSLYGMAHLPDFTIPEEDLPRDEDGKVIRPLRKVFDDEQAMSMAMQGLSHSLYTFWPDVVVFVSGFFVSASTLRVLRARRHKIVLIHTESPYQDDEQLIRAQFADLNLLNDPANVEEYRALVPNSHYMPHAYDPATHYLGKGEYETDFTFVGTMFKSRKTFFEKFVEAMKLYRMRNQEPYRVEFGGAGYDNDYMDDSPLLEYLGHPRDMCVDNSETANAYRRSRSGINFYRRESEGEHKGEGWAIGPREVEMAACGMPFLRDPRPESDELFPFLPSFSSPEEAADQLRWLLSDEDRREELGRLAREQIKCRTFDNNAKQMLKYLEK